MDVVMLSRLQFAVAVFFHFIFVPLTLGLSVIIAWMETRYVRTGEWQQVVLENGRDDCREEIGGTRL